MDTPQEKSELKNQNQNQEEEEEYLYLKHHMTKQLTSTFTKSFNYNEKSCPHFGIYRPKLKCIFLEGCHGVGKTFICNHLKNLGHNTISENFGDIIKFQKTFERKYDHPHFTIHRAQIQFILELERKIRKFYENRKVIKTLYIDRSFLTSIIYSTVLETYYYSKDLKFPDYMREIVAVSHDVANRLKNYCTIQYFVINSPNYDFLQKRIKKRILKEPWRKNRNEEDKFWTQHIQKLYSPKHFPYFVNITHTDKKIPQCTHFTSSDTLMAEFAATFANQS